jgi:putative intracellular protease/amidase
MREDRFELRRQLTHSIRHALPDTTTSGARTRTCGLFIDGPLTSWPSLWTDLRLAGAEAVDQEVVIDGQFTTSRSPADLPAFCPAIVEQFSGSRVPG